MSAIPFLPPGDPERLVAWRNGKGITRREFLQDVAALARRLPPAAHVLNHCEDRYHFLAGLAAALARRQVSLFPPSRAPQVLEELRRDYPGLYCLTDQRDEAAPLERFFYTREALPADGGGADPPAVASEQIVAIAFTSGSTGIPKRFSRSWGGFVREAEQAGASLGLDPQGGGCVVATVPAQHMYGFIASIILPIRFGYAVDSERPFYPEDIRRALADCPARAILVTTPVHVRACVLGQVRLPPLDFILSSTAPLSGELAARAEELFHTRVQEFYGSTETGAIARRRQAEGECWRTFEDIRVSWSEGGLCVQAPYFPEPVTLSDSVEVKSPREFVLFGRTADLVKIAGKRASLADLNRQLLAIEGVADGSFFLPDVPEGQDGREPRLTAFVVATGLMREDILAALRARIDAAFLPRPLHLVEALPRNATGKLPRAHLARLLEQAEAGNAT